MQPRDELAVLKALCARLAEALKDRDWEALEPIDAAIREALGRQAGHDLGPAVAKARAVLKRLHDQARQAGAEECQRLRQLLLAHLEYAEGTSAYGQIHSLQGDA